ncbi:MAG TPA: YceI family protein [Anaerolineae bacterium]
MLGKPSVFLTAGLLVLSACAAPAASPTTAPVSNTSSPPSPISLAVTPVGQAVTPTTEATALATASLASGSQPTPKTQPATTVTADNGATAAPQSGSAATNSYHLVLTQDGTEARFRVKEQLAGRNLPNDAVGTTQAVTGAIVIQPNGQIDATKSKIVVDVSSLKTDESRRDNFIKRNTLQTDQYPTATFVPTAVQGLPSPLPASGDVTFQITGDLTIHGTTKSSTWQVKGTITGQDLKGSASAAFKFGDFNMSPPRAAVVLSVEDNIRLELDFHLTRQA